MGTATSTTQAASKRVPSRYSRIWSAARALGITSNELHDIVERETGKHSLKDLTDKQVDYIGTLLWNMDAGREYVPKQTSSFKFEETPGGVSEGQYKKIIALMCELRKLDAAPIPATLEQRVAGIIKAYLRMSASSDNPYRWLKYYHGVKLIETIKGILDTAQRKAQARSGSG